MRNAALLLAAMLCPGLPPAQAEPAARAPEADSSLPPVGRSLFDFLVTTTEGERKVQRVPFPFAELLRHVGEQLEAGKETGIRSVLIPFGRSLQRNAAADEFVKYPRVVAAVVGEPATKQDGAGMLLKDRLYFGYHEKAAELEIISYNEAAGRFEFQVVKDYRAGGQRRLLYANRRMCLTCHQNQGPIFSRPPWDETNANPTLQQLLRAQRKEYYGVAVNLGADTPDAIDRATDRANLFHTVQRLWREGCEGPAGAQRSVRCRAEAFAAALKYRLTGDRQFDRQAAGYREALLPVLTESWRDRWPQGIAVPSPDLPNRDPLAALKEPQLANPRPAALRKAAEIERDVDPLLRREPIDLRFGARREDIEHFVRNLAEFVAAADIAALDRWLEAEHERAQRKAQVVRVPCQVIERARGMRPAQVEFGCVAPQGTSPDVVLAGWLEREGGRVVSGAFHRFTPSRGGVRDVPVLPAEIARTPDASEVAIDLKPGGLKLRIADGSAVARMTLRWRAPPHAGAVALVAGEADVWLQRDFEPVVDAIGAMVQESLDGRSDAFAALPFRRAAVMPALFAKLGLPRRDWCCIDAGGMPAPVALDKGRSESAAESLRPFYRACAACHGAREASPPGFLYGGGARAARSIDGCAERILFRLGMWSLPEDARPKTPMPPHTAVAAASLTDVLQVRELREYVAQRLRTKTGASVTEAELLARRYETLPRCAPAFD